jgi:hypothetical protein
MMQARARTHGNSEHVAGWQHMHSAHVTRICVQWAWLLQIRHGNDLVGSEAQ